MGRTYSRQKIGAEFALRFSVHEFFPRPLFLHQFRSLPKPRLLLENPPVWKSIGNDHVKMVVFEPLPKLAISEFFPVAVAQSWISVCRAGRLRYLNRDTVSGDQLRSKKPE